MITDDLVTTFEDARCAAMIAADVGQLEALFGDELTWVHASGIMDTKALLVRRFAEGRARCYSFDRSDVQILSIGSAAIVTGTVEMDAEFEHVRKTVTSRYLGVWEQAGSSLRLVRWQSTRSS